jgi:AcrR family transcriptional regulator
MARITASAKSDARQRLLETAARHFAREGLERANVDAISLDAGFAKGTLYNYFRSKEHLFAEVLAEACRRAIQIYSGGERHGSTRERLASLAAADVEILRREEGFHRVLIREAMSFREETYPLITEHLAPFLIKVQQILEEGATAGEVRNDLPRDRLALMFVGILTLLYVHHWGSQEAWPDLAEIPDLAVTVFLDGAARAPSTADET